MAVEYIAFIAEEDYQVFWILVTTPLPREYGMWLRVRERGANSERLRNGQRTSLRFKSRRKNLLLIARD
jgi:hypothetical protein